MTTVAIISAIRPRPRRRRPGVVVSLPLIMVVSNDFSRYFIVVQTIADMNNFEIHLITIILISRFEGRDRIN